MVIRDREQYEEWVRHPQTKDFKAALSAIRKHYSDSLIMGATLLNHADLTAQETARIVGIAYGIDLILEAFIEESQ